MPVAARMGYFRAFTSSPSMLASDRPVSMIST
jgi:hypothetical protein